MTDLEAQEREDLVEKASAAALGEAMAELVRSGNVAAASLKFSDKLVGAAMHELTERAPQEIAGSWPMVIAYARMQRTYERAERMGNTTDELKAIKAQADLVRERYR